MGICPPIIGIGIAFIIGIGIWPCIGIWPPIIGIWPCIGIWPPIIGIGIAFIIVVPLVFLRVIVGARRDRARDPPIPAVLSSAAADLRFRGRPAWRMSAV
jgi:hypothetical protein